MVAEKLILTEVFYPDLKIESVEEKGEKKWYLKGEFAVVGKPTQNGRVYPESVVKKAIDKLQKAIEERRLFGELDHPEDTKTSLSRVSHLITKLELQDGKVYGEALLLDTPCGQIAKEILKAGGKIGISSRGVGSTVNEGNLEIVQDDFELITFDLVANPADENAYPELVLEQKNKKKDDNDRQLIESQLQNLEAENVFLKQLLENICKEWFFERNKIPLKLREELEPLKFSDIKKKIDLSQLKERFEEKFDDVERSFKQIQKISEETERVLNRVLELESELKDKVEKSQKIVEEKMRQIELLVEEKQEMEKRFREIERIEQRLMLLEKENQELRQLYSGFRKFADKADMIIEKLSSNVKNDRVLSNTDLRNRIRELVKGKKVIKENTDIVDKQVVIDENIVINLDVAKRLAGLE